MALSGRFVVDASEDARDEGYYDGSVEELAGELKFIRAVAYPADRKSVV